MNISISTLAGEVIIRAAVPEDAERLHQLRLNALASHPLAFSADLDAAKANPPEKWAEQAEKYATTDEGVLCVAAAGELLVGMTGLARGYSSKTRHNGNIWGVYVDPQWRGLRIADVMLEQVGSWALAHGVTTLKLSVETGNDAAIRCYKRCGFVDYGVEPEALFYDGAYYDMLEMAKRLR